MVAEPDAGVSGDNAVTARPQRTVLTVSVLFSLSVYYANYGATVVDGVPQDASGVTLPLRALSVIALAGSLRWGRIVSVVPVLYLALFGIFLAHFASSVVIFDAPIDALFLNAAFLAPLLLPLSARQNAANLASILDVAAVVLVVQVVFSAVLLMLGRSLWLSEAFVGGVGNPSSFAMLCNVCLAHLLLGEQRSTSRGVGGLVLAVGAVMSKSLFGVAAAATLLGAAYVRHRQRAIVVVGGPVLLAAAILSLVVWFESDPAGQFILRKIVSLGGFLGLASSSAVTSESILYRVDIHRMLVERIAEADIFLLGGLTRGGYWGVDSQWLTYAGSFGVPLALSFVVLHSLTGLRALERWVGGEAPSLVALFALFTMIFATNRILDYFPVAFFYFVFVAWVWTDRSTAIRAVREGGAA